MITPQKNFRLYSLADGHCHVSGGESLPRRSCMFVTHDGPRMKASKLKSRWKRNADQLAKINRSLRKNRVQVLYRNEGYGIPFGKGGEK